MAGFGAAAASGCSDQLGARVGAAGEGRVEAVGLARQAIGGAAGPTCVTIRRAGAAGTVLDTQIANKTPPKTYGGSGTMNAGPILGEERQSLVRFDTSSIVVPPNTIATVTQGVMTLIQGNLANLGGADTITAHRITAPWVEATVTWQSFNGAYAPAPLASVANAPGPFTFDIASLVAGWLDGTVPNHGVLVAQASSATNFWSSEAPVVSNRPSLDVCYTLSCAAGFADCDGASANGCETALGTIADCGGCGQACSFANAAPACVNGSCAISACNLGFGDCDGNQANGCETLLSTNQNCGACGAPCALPHGASTCGSGTCALTGCDAGFFDCDGNPANGCEALPCGNGSNCASSAGCASGVCVNGTCASPTCVDGVQNGGESALDCGGGACPACQPGQACFAASDCATGVCSAGVCQPATCADAVKNGNEASVDCGGSCPACAAGQGCSVGADCQSGVCVAGVCEAPACNDGIKNGSETAVDCGGGACPACAPGKACLTGSDCADLVCLGDVCQMASCTDGAKNGAETGVDCGGTCPPCGNQEPCSTSADCQSGVCANGVCQTPTCSDGVKNGNETGVDCGGACFVAETCDGIDNDCNGLVDDGLGNITCGVGACQVTVPACANGAPQTCVPNAPRAEQCDGLIDDDCDGVVDNGCACVNGATQSCYTASPSTLGVGVCAAGTQTCVLGQWGACVGEVTPTAEACDGADNDCNGQVDDGLGQTICGVGGCQVTVQNCVGGVPQTCVPTAPEAETCDGIDNDCNGSVDDDLPAITCGVGACQRTAPSCVNGNANTCTPGAPSPEVCDGIDNDCNGAIDDNNPGGGLSCSTGNLGACAAGTTACSGGQIVCNQIDQPAAEICDGVDNDCDGQVDEGNPGGGLACNTGNLGACAAGLTVCSSGQLSCQQTHQPTAEVCDGIDNDCDGVIDNGNPGGGQSCSTGLQGICAGGTTACSAGQIVCNQDLQAHPETCDGLLDENCNGQVDEGCNCVDGATQSCYTGAVGTVGIGACHAGTQMCLHGNWTACVGEVIPTAETCNGVDDNCDGQVDDGLGILSCGVGACARAVPACVNGAANTCVPGAPTAEVCDGIDNNCDGSVDEGNPGSGAACNTGNHGICGPGTTSCLSGAIVCVQTNSPQPETCDGLDNDCDGSVDDGVSTTYYRDADGDGWGDPLATVQACSQPIGYVARAGDCDDTRFAVKPGGLELCNGLDDDCNGLTDELVTQTFYRDADGDGYGNTALTTQACVAPSGYVAIPGDCDDSNATKNPGITELCNGLDDNCDGQVDEDDAGGGAACTTGLVGVCNGGTIHCVSGALVCQQNQFQTWYEDLDDDGYGTTVSTLQSCTQPDGYAPFSGDCDDSDPDVYPGAPEVCDTLDNNCNGQIDENPVSPPTWYRDLDGDGYGTTTPSIQQCAQPAGFVAIAGDCNDSDANVSPGASELCDGLDNNCNGIADEGNPGSGQACSTGKLGVCAAGITACVSGAIICNQTNASGTEVCDGLDNDCDGVVDDGGVCNCVPGAVVSCYTGPAGTQGVGICKAGTQTCNAQGTGYGACTGEVLPASYENCATAADDNCDGTAPSCSGASSYQAKFGSTSSDPGYGVAVDPSGNVFATGLFQGTVNFGGGNLVSAGLYDAYLTKRSSTGTHIWTKKLGGTSYDYGYAVAADAQGNVAMVGEFRGTVNFGGGNLVSNGASFYDVFVAKYDSAGNHKWSKKFGGTNHDYGYNIATDSQSNVIVVGVFQGTANFGGGNLVSAGGYDMFIVKYDANGNHLWSKKLGGTSSDYAYGLAIDSQDNVVIGGIFQGTVNFGGGNLVSSGSHDMVLAKYNSAGTFVWAKKFGDASDNRAYAVAVDASDNIALTGFFKGTVSFGGSSLSSNGGTTYYDTFLAKFSSAGAHQWSKRFGGTNHDQGLNVKFDKVGNIVLAGYFAGTTNLGGANLASAGSYDVFLAKYDGSGNHLYSKKFGDGSAQYARTIAIDPSNNIWMTGYFQGTVNFGGGNLTSAGSNDVFLAKFAP